jgi:hypothetical protein
LRRTRAAVLNTLVFMAVVIIVTWPMYSLLGLGSLLAIPPGRLRAVLFPGLVVAAFAAVFVFLFSRSGLVTGLDERGFGLRGLANWALCGLLAGLLGALADAALLRWPAEDSLFYHGLDALAPFAVIAFSYWLVFRRSPFALAQTVSTSTTAENQRAASWFLVAGGLLVAGVGGTFQAVELVQARLVSLPALIAQATGLAGALIGLGVLTRSRPRWGCAALALGLALAAAGLALWVVMSVRQPLR